MLAAQLPVQRPPDAKLLVVDAQRNLIHVPRSAFVDFLHADDLVIANDAATLPASLFVMLLLICSLQCRFVAA